MSLLKFNNMGKITDKTVKVWSALLNNVQESQLIIKSSNAMDQTVLRKLLEKFNRFGITSNRINSFL